jgi:hypothetical protein
LRDRISNQVSGRLVAVLGTAQHRPNCRARRGIPAPRPTPTRLTGFPNLTASGELRQRPKAASREKHERLTGSHRHG